MGYRSIGYSVINRFGERIWTGDKKHCELMIRANGWQNVVLVEIFGYQKQTVKKKKPKAPPKKVVWQIEHKSGTVLSFPNIERVSQFIGIPSEYVYRYMKNGDFQRSGRAKGWKFTMEVQ